MERERTEGIGSSNKKSEFFADCNSLENYLQKYSIKRF